MAGVLVGTALSLGVSTVKATFVAGVVAAFVALVPVLGGIDVEDELEDEGVPPCNASFIAEHLVGYMQTGQFSHQRRCIKEMTSIGACSKVHRSQRACPTGGCQGPHRKLPGGLLRAH